MSTARGKIIKLLVSSALVGAIIWQFTYARQLTLVENEAYLFTPKEFNRLDKFPRAQYAYGLKAWLENRLEAADAHFKRAVSNDMLFINAWLKLSQTEFSLGNREKAVQILNFTHRLTRDTIRWKWEHVLLARELGQEDIFLKSINDAISCKALERDGLQLLDMHFDQDVARILPVTAEENRPAYLLWLMRWNRVEDAWMVWNSLPEATKGENRLYEQYVDFLLRNGAPARAAMIWQKFTGINGITNPGFEQELLNKGFGWRYRTSENQPWDLERTRTNPAEGRYSLSLSFNGSENIRFNNVWQVVPVAPGTEYLLSYRRKSRNLTTDERPFIDIFCFDGTGDFHRSGSMLPEDSDWQEERISFTSPAQCQAVVVQITRNPSHRFGCKISGKAWFDDFRIDRLSDWQVQDRNQE